MSETDYDVSEKSLQILRTVDKLDRIGIEGCVELLKGDPEEVEGGCGCNAYEVEVWTRYMRLADGADTNEEILRRLGDCLAKLALVNKLQEESPEIYEKLAAWGVKQ